MKKAILIKRTVKTLYLENGIVLNNLSSSEKLNHSIFGETKTMIQEDVIETFFYKNKKDVDTMFWNYVNEKNIDCSDLYVVFQN